MLRAPFVLLGNVFYLLRFLLSQGLFRFFSMFNRKKHYVQIVFNDDVPIGQHRLARWFGEKRTFLGFRQQVKQLANDHSVEGVIVRLDKMPGGRTRTKDVIDELGKLKTAGKKLIGHTDQASLQTMASLSAFDDVVVSPPGRLYTFGMRIENFFLKNVMEKVGVGAQFLHIGEFKTATNRFVRDSMGDSEKAMMTSLLDGLEENMKSSIATARDVPIDAVSEVIDQAPTEPRVARQLGLIDGEAFFPDLKRWIPMRDEMTLAGGGDPEQMAHITPEDQYVRPLPWRWRALFRKPRYIAVLDLHGMIVAPGTQNPSDTVISCDHVIPVLRDLANNRRVAGVLIHINSPGGSALASDLIWNQLERLRAAKPVVAYLGDVAASGGYYIAVGADQIVCRPESITGSIGVITGKISLGDAAEKLGVGIDAIQNHETASFMSMTEPMSDTVRENFAVETRSFYRRFLERVGMARRIPKRRLHRFARGRVYLGTQALERGLVDELGGFDAALDRLKWLIEEDGHVAPERIGYVPHAKPNLGAALRRQALTGSNVGETVSELIESDMLKTIELLQNEQTLALMPFRIK